MEITIIGRKSSGKTRLFSILTGLEYRQFANEKQIGVAFVPDERVDKLSEYYKPKKTINAKVTFIDLPGVDKDEFYSSKRVAEYKNSDALIYLIPYFSGYTTESSLSIEDEIKRFEDESIISDLASVETRVASLTRTMQKRKEKEDEIEMNLMQKLMTQFEAGKALRFLEFSEDEEIKLKGFSFLTLKPILFVVNIDDEKINVINGIIKNLKDKFQANHFYNFSFISCDTEYDLMNMDKTERDEFLKELNLQEDGRTRVLKDAFSLLDKICFFTVGEDEVRAWPIKRGTKAKEAAGQVHTDIEKGFIRAEVFNYNDWDLYKSEEKIKEMKLFRLEMKDYVVKDGDIMHFRFNK